MPVSAFSLHRRFRSLPRTTIKGDFGSGSSRIVALVLEGLMGRTWLAIALRLAMPLFYMNRVGYL